MEIDQLKYPIGRFIRPSEISDVVLAEWTKIIDEFPGKLKAVLSGVKDEELDYRYRPGGWSIRQVVHHCADSHMNSFIRFKLALTEENPTIKPYFEERWAELSDVLDAPVEYSVALLVGLHKRWAIMLKSLSPVLWQKKFIHPEHGREVIIKDNLGIYAWHCEHHLAHIKQAKVLKGVFDEV